MFTSAIPNPRSFCRLAVIVGMLLTGFSAGVLSPQPAQAQGVFDMGMLTNTLSQGSGSRGGHRHHPRGTPLKAALTRPGGTKTGRTTRVAFTPSAAVRKRSITTFVNRVRLSDPQAATAFETEFARKNGFDNLGRTLAVYGLRTDSVTDAFTAYLVSSWQGAHGITSEPTKAQVRGVQKQMGQVFADIPALTSASNVKKQEFAEALLLQTVLIDTYMDGAKARPDLIPKMKASLALGAQSAIGFDLRTFKLTSKGLSL